MIDSLFNAIDRISHEFNLLGLVNVSEINIGNVNHTCRVAFLFDCWMNFYIVQKVNTYVFRKPWDVMHNIVLTTEFMTEHHPDIKSFKCVVQPRYSADNIR